MIYNKPLNYVQLGQICKLQGGFAFPKASQGRRTGKYPFIKVSDMNRPENSIFVEGANNWIDDSDIPQLRVKLLPSGTTVFAKIGEALKQNRRRLLVRPTVIDNNMMGAIPYIDRVDHRFLYYALSQFDFADIAGGTAVPYLTIRSLSSLRLLLPTIRVQRAIAHILGTLDNKIELNRRMSETLEETARTLFKCWFVDFEPVRAKIGGRWGLGESLPGLPAHLYDLFPNQLTSSEAGQIPSGWHIRNTGSFFDDVIGGDWGKSTRDPINTELVSVIRGTDLKALANGKTGLVPQRYSTLKKVKRRVLRAGDIVLEVSGGSPTQSTGRSLLITNNMLSQFSDPVVCASFCRRLRPRGINESILISHYLSYLYDIDKMWEYQKQSTGISNFETKRFLEEERFVWPGDRVAAKLIKYLEPILFHTAKNESVRLETIRGLLISKLLSGELNPMKVREVEYYES